MSFTFGIYDIVNLGDHSWLRGRLVKGAYYGPQNICLTSTTGERRTTAVLKHDFTGFVGWPVTADHHVLLDLYIDTPRPPFLIDPNRLVEGVGSAPDHAGEQFLLLSQQGGMPAQEFDERFADWKRRAGDLDRRLSRNIKKFPIGKLSTVGEIRSLFEDIIEQFENMNELQRQLVVNCLNNNFDSLMYRSEVSGTLRTEEGFRKRILLFVISDQGKDPRDSILTLAHYKDVGERCGFDVGKIFRQAAPLASNLSKYGWSSTRAVLLRSAGPA